MIPTHDEPDREEPRCLFCNAPERVEIFEIWSDGAFQIECCCEGLHETVVFEMADDPAWARELMQRKGVEVITGSRLRRVADDGGCSMLLDYQLELHPIAFGAARDFVARYHRHCAAPVTWRFGKAVWNGRVMVGVVMAGNPVAPALNGRGIVEVNRLCIRRDVPRALAWNAASMLYGWAAREAALRGWSKIITYTRSDEAGTSLVASGWEREAVTRGRGWHSKGRRRSNTNAFIDKVRWSKQLRPRRQAKPGESHDVAAVGPVDLLLDPLFRVSPSGGDRLLM